MVSCICVKPLKGLGVPVAEYITLLSMCMHILTYTYLCDVCTSSCAVFCGIAMIDSLAQIILYQRAC